MPISFDVSADLIDLGIACECLLIRNLKNVESHAEFESLRRRELEPLQSNLTIESLARDPVLTGFRELHRAVGCLNRRNVPAPENLLKMLVRTGDIPRVNLIVDIYNLISVKSRLALGAHDIQRVTGNIHLRITDGTEGYWPLGSTEPKIARSGEYAYVDDANDIICRLEVRQVQKTKVTTATRDCFYIVQGNRATNKDYIASATQELIDLTTGFCGGEAEIIYAP